jgi:hypothetical protein
MAGNQSQLSLAAATLTFPCSQSHLCKQGRSISAGTHTFQMVIKTRSCVRQITVGCSGNTVWNLRRRRMAARSPSYFSTTLCRGGLRARLRGGIVSGLASPSPSTRASSERRSTRSGTADPPPLRIPGLLATTAAARDLVRCGHVMRSRRVLPCGPWPAGVHVVSLAE